MSDKFINLIEYSDQNISDFNTKESEVRRVTLPMALQIANKVMGVKVDGIQLSSQYEINKDSASVQEVNGELIWVLPLDYSGFFKWLDLDYIPGYITLSATDPKAKAKLVKGKRISVSDKGFFYDNIERNVWMKSGLMQTKTHFEINDEGHPFYISIVVKPEIGFHANNIDSVIVTDAESGEMDKVELSDVKSKYPWIDRIWSEDIIAERIEWFGSYQGGFKNKYLSGTNVSVPTSYNGQELWLVKANSSLHWFTGMTSKNQSDQSLVSAIFVEAGADLSKPILHQIEMNMVSDELGAVQAMESALGADATRWDPVLPQPYIVSGEFYWTSVIVSESTNIFQKTSYMKGDDITNVTFNSLKKYNPNVGEDDSSLSEKENLLRQIMKKLDEVKVLKERYDSL